MAKMPKLFNRRKVADIKNFIMGRIKYAIKKKNLKIVRKKLGIDSNQMP